MAQVKNVVESGLMFFLLMSAMIPMTFRKMDAPVHECFNITEPVTQGICIEKADSFHALTNTKDGLVSSFFFYTCLVLGVTFLVYFIFFAFLSRWIRLDVAYWLCVVSSVGMWSMIFLYSFGVSRITGITSHIVTTNVQVGLFTMITCATGSMVYTFLLSRPWPRHPFPWEHPLNVPTDV